MIDKVEQEDEDDDDDDDEEEEEDDDDRYLFLYEAWLHRTITSTCCQLNFHLTIAIVYRLLASRQHDTAWYHMSVYPCDGLTD